MSTPRRNSDEELGVIPEESTIVNTPNFLLSGEKGKMPLFKAGSDISLTKASRLKKVNDLISQKDYSPQKSTSNGKSQGLMKSNALIQKTHSNVDGALRQLVTPKISEESYDSDEPDRDAKDHIGTVLDSRLRRFLSIMNLVDITHIFNQLC